MAWPWFAETALEGRDEACEENVDGWMSGLGLFMTLPYGWKASWVSGRAVTLISELTCIVMVILARLCVCAVRSKNSRGFVMRLCRWDLGLPSLAVSLYVDFMSGFQLPPHYIRNKRVRVGNAMRRYKMKIKMLNKRIR